MLKVTHLVLKTILETGTIITPLHRQGNPSTELKSPSHSMLVMLGLMVVLVPDLECFLLPS